MIERDDGSDSSGGATGPENSGRRDAIKKVGLATGVAGAAWAAPMINGVSVVSSVAGAQTTLPPIVEGTPISGLCVTKSLGCYSGAFGTVNSHNVSISGGGHWNFYFQGCGAGNTESVALAAGPPSVANNYEPPPGYKCKMILHNGNTGNQIYDTGYVANPINGVADTGGVIFISTAQFPNGQNKVCVVIKCDPV